MHSNTEHDEQCLQHHFDCFVAEHLPGLARYARMLTGDREDAHDALAETLIKVQRAWPRIIRMQYPLAYVRRTLSNTVISSRRKWSYRHVSITPSGLVPDCPSPDATGMVDHLDELQQLLLTLTLRQRSMIVMRFYLDLSDSEIAEQLKCSPVTVRATISRALGALRVTSSHYRDTDSPPRARTALQTLTEVLGVQPCSRSQTS